MNPRISIIVPCYNVENQVRDCLDSIINQTIGTDRIEVILIDDCSIDNTVSVLKEYESKYRSLFKLVLLDKNGRQGRARNIGLEYAKGDYISFVDSDDYIRKDMFEILLDVVDVDDLDLVQFRYKGVRGVEEQIVDNNSEFTIYEYGKNRREYLLNSHVLNESCCQKIYKRNLIEKSQVRFAEGVTYEEPLFTYPLKYYVDRVAVTEEPLYYYRLNEQGTTALHMKDPSKMAEHLYVQNLLYSRMRNEVFYEEYKQEIDLYFIHCFFVEPFYFYTARNQVMDLGFFRYICERVLHLLPEYHRNPYLKDESLSEERVIISLIKDNDNLNDEMMKKRILDIQKLIAGN